MTESGSHDAHTSPVRVVLPYHLRNIARVGHEVTVQVHGAVTPAAILDALESAYPMLQGAIRDHGTLRRRPFIRYFACAEDISLEPVDTELPEAIARGTEPFMVVGAIAGG